MYDNAVLSSILFAGTAYIWLSRGRFVHRKDRDGDGGDSNTEEGHPPRRRQVGRSTPPSGLPPPTIKRFGNVEVATNDRVIHGSPHRSPRTPGFVRVPADGNETEERLERRRRADSLDERRRQLLERVAYSDSVFSRENSMDYHPKNSNWSHFEK